MFSDTSSKDPISWKKDDETDGVLTHKMSHLNPAEPIRSLRGLLIIKANKEHEQRYPCQGDIRRDILRQSYPCCMELPERRLYRILDIVSDSRPDRCMVPDCLQEEAGIMKTENCANPSSGFSLS